MRFRSHSGRSLLSFLRGRIIKPTRVFKSSSCPNTLNESQFDQRRCHNLCPQQSPPSCIVST
ncbi:hypothetical protein Hanom_Chr05g00450191 [Helianthus anomalus]